jgi:hypothetical protein
MTFRFPAWSALVILVAAIPAVGQTPPPPPTKGVPLAPTAPILGPTSGAAGAVTVEHTPPACILAAQFIRLEATAKPADKVERGHVYFRAEGEPDWYYVDMQRSGATFAATLPKPEKTTKGVHYYIEILDAEYHVGRTPESAPVVVVKATECRGKPVARTVPSATIGLYLPPAAPAVPPGFLGDGVTAK